MKSSQIVLPKHRDKSDNKAVVGRNAFAHERGIHTAGVIKNPFIYEPYPLEIVGAERKLMIRATSGRG